MAKIDIISGFLGAGKTTLIRKLIQDALAGQQVCLIENEFGEIGIDGGFLKEAGIEITEMSQGCICCSLVGDFAASLKQVTETYHPQRILIEPTGVGKLSEIMKAIDNAAEDAGLEFNSAVAVVDASKAKVYIRNFGEFFIDQVTYAGTIVLTRIDKITPEKLQEVVDLLRGYNKSAAIITTQLDQLSGLTVLETMEKKSDLSADLMAEVMQAHHDEEDDDDDDEDEHEHHHHHDDDDDEDEHEHHHHHHHDDEDDDEECCCHHHHHDEEEHHPEEDEDGNKVYGGHHHHHHHHHHHGHDADEIFTSWGMETPSRFTAEEVEQILASLEDEEKYGVILRSKGMVQATDGSWIHFDYVPGEAQVRSGAADITGKICVIGSELKEDALYHLFLRK